MFCTYTSCLLWEAIWLLATARNVRSLQQFQKISLKNKTYVCNTLRLLLWLQIMNKNDTCFQGNNTDTCQPQNSSSSVAVGLLLFFLILAIAIAAIAFIYRSKIMTLLGSLQGRTQKKEVCAESPQADNNTYTGMSREQPQVQTPIYENLGKTKDPLERPAAKQSR